MPIQWLCDGTAKQTGPFTVESTCGAGQSCVGGTCVDSKVDSSKLPSYSAPDVFGGGTGAGDGACFDTLGCFAKGSSVALTADGGCSIAKPEGGGDVSIGLVKAPGTDGICGPEACIIPLDADGEGGWTEQNGLIVLPQAVCDKVGSGDVKALAVTTACAQKTSALPPCGAWSSVTTTPATTDAGAPSADAGGGGGGFSCPTFTGDTTACLPVAVAGAPACPTDGPAACTVIVGDTVVTTCATPSTLPSDVGKQGYPCNTQADCNDGFYCPGANKNCSAYCCTTADCAAAGPGLSCATVTVGTATIGVCQGT
jgi:hypothetical protein